MNGLLDWNVICILDGLAVCTILLYRRTWNVNVLISFQCTNDLPPLSSLNQVVVVTLFPNLSTRPSTKTAGPFGISPPTAFPASSSKLGSSSNVHSSSPPYALGRFCASIRVRSVGPGSLPRTYILFRVPSSNQPLNHPQIVGKYEGELTTTTIPSVSG